MATFGELLAELRQDKGLTQKQLGRVLSVSTGTISNYENGVHYLAVIYWINLLKKSERHWALRQEAHV